jgi:hypothetical protein
MAAIFRVLNNQKIKVMVNSLTMTPLSLDQVKQNAPQAFAATPKPGVSSKYSFLSTSRIIEDMDRLGWKVNQAKSNRSRTSVNAEYGNHVVKFFHPDVYMKDQNGDVEAYVNIVVMNNHMGTGSFKFEMGIFRLVCENGLILKDKDFGGFNMRHSGYSFEQLQETLNQAMEQLPQVVSRINTYNQIIMSKEAQKAFAQQAFALRSYQDRQLTEIELEEFLAPRRKEDEGDSLWVVLNRIQESVLKGGYSITNKKNKLRRAKSIKNIQQDIKLNQQVWELAGTFA